MPAIRQRVMLDILEEHFEELQFLCAQRQNAVVSPLYLPLDLARLDERIESHMSGLLVGGDALIDLVQPALDGTDPIAGFAAALALLRRGSPPAIKALAIAVASAGGAQMSGLGEAMIFHATVPQPILAALQEAAGSDDLLSAAEANAVLASRAPGSVAPRAEALDRFLKNEDPLVRRAGWRLVPRLATVARLPYTTALKDEDPGVRTAVIFAAAWTRQPVLLEHLRSLTASPDPGRVDELTCLAMLGRPEELPRMEKLAKCVTLGPARFAIAGTFGHPSLVDSLLLPAMASPDPVAAAAAGAAFLKVTGIDVATGDRATVAPPPGADVFDREFASEVEVPDAARARAEWDKLKPAFSAGIRWGRGQNLSDYASLLAAIPNLDMESRYQAHLRARYRGEWNGSLGDLHKTPSARPGTSPPAK